MNMTFICANHRAWLTDQPEQALHCCLNSSEAGWILYQEGRWQEALPLLGSAYESAEIVLSSGLLEQKVAIDNFLYALAGLTQALVKLEHFDSCKAVYRAAITRMSKECRSCDVSNEAELSRELSRLQHELGNLDDGKYTANFAYYADAYKPNQWNMTLH